MSGLNRGRARISRTARQAGVPPALVRWILDAVLLQLSVEIRSRRQVRVEGFGTFQTTVRPPRRCRHPKTGEPIVRPAKKRVWFYPSFPLRVEDG